MIRIGRYKFGIAAFSTVVVFIVLSVCAVVTAVNNSRQEWPMPLWGNIVINECLALVVTLVYGIILHFAIAIINRLREHNGE